MPSEYADTIGQFRIVLPDQNTTGYSRDTAGEDGVSCWGRYVVEHGEEYQDDFRTLEAAQAHVTELVGVDRLEWTQVRDGRGIPGWDCKLVA